MKTLEIVPYARVYGPAGRFGQYFPPVVAATASKEIETLQCYMIGVVGLGSLLLKLPLGRAGVVLFPGILPTKPLPDAIKLAENLESPLLLVAGHHRAGPGDTTEAYYSASNVQAELGYFGQLKLPFLSQGFASRTAAQAAWTAELVEEHKLEALVIMAASAHLYPRAFGTLLQALNRRGRRIPLIPVPHPMNPFVRNVPCWSNSPEENTASRCSQVEFHGGDHQRVLDYSSRADPEVASLDDLTAYGLWLAEHPFFAD